MDSEESFATRLRALRLSRGMTQAAVGEVIGIKGQAVNDMEHGRVKTSLDRAIQLADFFDVSLDYLVGRSEEPRRR
jgi:transcriptional regulator with XRE-family HTH domain